MGGQENQDNKGVAPEKPPAPAGFTPLFVALTPAELSARLPQFEILELLGQGGMGAVYKARQPRLDRFVAIKLLPPLLDEDVHSFGKRFEREARAMAQLNHPNIVRVHDFGETEDGLRYFVMEYVDGTDLHKAIATRKVTAAHVLAWAPQICAGLSYAHAQHLVHRDIKPANILISREGQVKVGDFGLAKLVGASRDMSLTQSQVSMGTPDYAAPEAMRAGASVDQRADIYSFGVVLYEMLTGIVPRGAWKAPSALCPVDPRLDRIVIRAMQPDRDHRYQRMAQIAEALEEVKLHPEPPAGELILKAVPVPDPVTKQKRAHPLAVAFIALASAAAVAAGILYGTTYYAKATGRNPFLLPGGRAAPVAAGNGSGAPTVPPKVTAAPKASTTGNKPALPEPPPEKRKPPGIQDGWVSLQSVVGDGVEPPGGGWSTSLDDLIYDGRGRGGSGSRLFLGPPPPAFDYEFRLEVVEGGLTHPLAVRLPVGNDTAHALFGVSAPGGGRERFAGLALARSPDPGAPGNPSRHLIVEPKGASCRIVFRVVRKGSVTGIEATVNGQLAIAWAGQTTELAGLDSFRGSGVKKLLGLAASHPVSLHGIDCRAVPAGTWLTHADDLPPVPAPDSTKPVGTPVVPGPTPPPAPETPRMKLEARLAELRARHEGLEKDVVRSAFERNMATLRESYQAALNRTIDESGSSLSITAAAQRELTRIREKGPIEPVDPPEMPEVVRKLRERYRMTVNGFESELSLATAPILREHIAAVNGLSAEASWKEPALAKLIQVETTRLESRLRDVLAASGAQAQSASVTAAPPVAPAPAPVLARPPFPPSRPQVKGSLLLLPRSRESLMPAEMEKIPGGLNGNVVDLAIGESFIVALKSNGRVSLWGTGVPETLREDVESVDRVSRVAVAQRGKYGQIALLLEDGRIESRTMGVAATGLPGVDPVTAKFANLVDVAVTPVGGVALDREGNLLPWGVFAAFPGMPGEIMQLRPAGVGVVALGANGIPVYLTAAGLPPGLPVGVPVQDIQFGVQEEAGMIIRTPDGKLQTAGSFAGLAKDLEALTRNAVVRRVEAGDQGIALQTQDEGWRFLGEGFDSDLEKKLAGCTRVLVSKTFVAGLMPE